MTESREVLKKKSGGRGRGHVNGAQGPNERAPHGQSWNDSSNKMYSVITPSIK